MNGLVMYEVATWDDSFTYGIMVSVSPDRS